VIRTVILDPRSGRLDVRALDRPPAELLADAGAGVLREWHFIEVVGGDVEDGTGGPRNRLYTFVARSALDGDLHEALNLLAHAAYQAGVKSAVAAKGYPLYEMVENGDTKWLPFHQAAALYDSGHSRVDFGSFVIGLDGEPRRMTAEDQRSISRAADDYSASK
jgi:hypothetical protein